MQDRFKFRAWNKLSNELKDVKSLNINQMFPDCSNVILETNSFDSIKTNNLPIECANGLNNVILMQCTGLKDQNGKLIYEGDIVRYYSPYFMKFFTAKVIFNEKEACFTMRGNEASYMISIIAPNINEKEVIGNLYENPELLEEVKYE